MAGVQPVPARQGSDHQIINILVHIGLGRGSLALEHRVHRIPVSADEITGQAESGTLEIEGFDLIFPNRCRRLYSDLAGIEFRTDALIDRGQQICAFFLGDNPVLQNRLQTTDDNITGPLALDLGITVEPCRQGRNFHVIEYAVGGQAR